MVLSVKLPDALKAIRVCRIRSAVSLMPGSSLAISQLRVTILNSSDDKMPIIAGPGASVTKKVGDFCLAFEGAGYRLQIL